MLNYRFLILAFLLFSLTGYGEVLGQTYTTSGLSTNWDDPLAWVKTNPEGCATPNPANTPLLGPIYAACDIRIIINHPITRAGNANIGGGNVRSITVNQGGEVTFGGNVTVNNVGPPAFLFQINDGAKFTTGGTLGIRAGATFNVVNTSNLEPKTYVQVNNLTFLNSGSGQSVNVGVNTIFNVIGQTRLEGGGALNIQGEFNSNTFNSANSGGNQVNVSGDGLIRTIGNMQIEGYPLNLSGNAGVVVGGILTITNSGNSSLNLNGPNTNFTVLTSGSSIAGGKTPSGSCFQIPENGNTCDNTACLEILTTPLSGNQLERIFIFKCSMTWTVPSDSLTIASGDSLEIIDSFRALTVAGGGGGGRGISSGGGGGGGIVYEEDLPLNSGNQLTITVGKGGLGSTSPNARGGNGQNSQIQGRPFAVGGGGGGSTANAANSSSRAGNPGGSGGGSGNTVNNETIAGGFSTSSIPPTITNPDNSNTFGFNGGASAATGANRAGGGGGGSGSIGNSGSRTGPNNVGGNGGTGTSFNISGNSLFYSAGGGGNANNIKGSGGSSIGGSADGTGTLRNGATNSGSGGGATNSGAGGNGGSGIVIIRTVILRILPVEFLYFKAEFNSFMRSGDLSWATAKEWENDRFEIERSVNDVKSWETIGQVTGAGYSDTPMEYIYQDMKLPLAGGNIFYRLKQFDFSGQFSYSDTKAIRVAPMSGTTYWKVYPNPTTGDPINLELLDKKTYRDEKITVRVVSVSGQYEVIQSDSPELLSTRLSEILRGKAAGIYTVEISWGAQREYHKVILRR